MRDWRPAVSSMTYTGTFLEKIHRAGDAASFHFTRPSDYRFEAGQSFIITIPSSDGPLQHCFSHADSPTEGCTELTTRLTGSPFKNALDALPPGATATFKGPNGHFVFPFTEPKIAYLVGGVGITPVRGILRYLADTQGVGRAPAQEIVLFYGCMTEDGIIYRAEIDEYMRLLPGARVIYVITEPSADWSGYSGFITPQLVRAELGAIDDWVFFTAGPPPMIVAMEKLADTLGIVGSRLLKESFAGYSS
jgi:ferredoxin-NADP reductase